MGLIHANLFVHELQRNFEQLSYEAEVAEKLKTEPKSEAHSEKTSDPTGT